MVWHQYYLRLDQYQWVKWYQINSTSPIMPAILAAITTLTPQITKISKITVQIIPTVDGSL